MICDLELNRETLNFKGPSYQTVGFLRGRARGEEGATLSILPNSAAKHRFLTRNSKAATLMVGGVFLSKIRKCG